MFSTSRKLGAICFILAVVNIVGLVMLTLYFIGLNMSFATLFTCLLYVITCTTIGLLLTISVRSFVQDAELESSSTSAQISKLKERIEELEKLAK